MANVVSLLQYLQWGLPGLLEGEHGSSDRKTTNTRYNPLHISLMPPVTSNPSWKWSLALQHGEKSMAYT